MVVQLEPLRSPPLPQQPRPYNEMEQFLLLVIVSVGVDAEDGAEGDSEDGPGPGERSHPEVSLVDGGRQARRRLRRRPWPSGGATPEARRDRIRHAFRLPNRTLGQQARSRNRSKTMDHEPKEREK